MSDEKSDKTPPGNERGEQLPRRFPNDGGRPWGGYGRAGSYFDNLNLPDAPLTPHQPYTRIKYTGKVPRVLISPEAYKRMQLYVELARLEVGWLGTAERLETGDYYIEHVFLLRQTAGAAHAKISIEGQSELYSSLMKAGRREDTRRLFFWGHSHVRMDTAPSPQDEETMREFGEQGCDWYIRGIMNKLGRATFDVFVYEQKVNFIDVPWEIWSPQPGVEEEEPKTGLAAVGESLNGLKDKVVKGTKRLLETFSTDPVSKPRSQTKGPLHISAELRAEVEAEIRDKVTISYMPDFGNGYGEVPLLEELARARAQEKSGTQPAAQIPGPPEALPPGTPGAQPNKSAGIAPDPAAAQTAEGNAVRTPAPQIPGPPEALPSCTTGGGALKEGSAAASAANSSTTRAPDAQGE